MWACGRRGVSSVTLYHIPPSTRRRDWTLYQVFFAPFLVIYHIMWRDRVAVPFFNFGNVPIYWRWEFVLISAVFLLLFVTFCLFLGVFPHQLTLIKGSFWFDAVTMCTHAPFSLCVSPSVLRKEWLPISLSFGENTQRTPLIAKYYTAIVTTISTPSNEHLNQRWLKQFRFLMPHTERQTPRWA